MDKGFKMQGKKRCGIGLLYYVISLICQNIFFWAVSSTC